MRSIVFDLDVIKIEICFHRILNPRKKQDLTTIGEKQFQKSAHLGFFFSKITMKNIQKVYIKCNNVKHIHVKGYCDKNMHI